MLSRFLALALVGLFSVTLPAQTSLNNAWRAQALLGGGVWSQVIEVKNRSRASVYPERVHALVFELAGILWFYTDTDGTQSFSLHRGRLEQEKADIGPLLRDIDPGFDSWVVVPEAPSAPVERHDAPLKNGCFIESVVALRERLMRGAKAEAPRLLSYYSKTNRGQWGHTVLAYDVEGHVEIFDPARPDRRLMFPPEAGGDAVALARLLEDGSVIKARYLPLSSDLPVAAVATSAGRTRSKSINASRS